MCSRVWRAWRAACASRSLLAARTPARTGRRRAAPWSRPRRACRRAACTSMSGRSAPSLGLDRALLQEVAVARPCRPSRRRCAAGSPPRSRASRAASAPRRGCRSPGAACRRPRRAGGPSARARPGPDGARARGARSRSPSARASPGPVPTRPLISSVRLAISPAARSCSAPRASATLCASEAPVWAITSSEIAFSSSRIRARLGARDQRRAERAEQDSEDSSRIVIAYSPG